MVEPSKYSLAILFALQKKRPGEVYAGTVPVKTRLERRGQWGAYARRRAALRRRFIIAQRSAAAGRSK